MVVRSSSEIEGASPMRLAFVLDDMVRSWSGRGVPHVSVEIHNGSALERGSDERIDPFLLLGILTNRPFDRKDPFRLQERFDSVIVPVRPNLNLWKIHHTNVSIQNPKPFVHDVPMLRRRFRSSSRTEMFDVFAQGDVRTTSACATMCSADGEKVLHPFRTHR